MHINPINNMSFQGLANKKQNKAKKAAKSNNAQDTISLSTNKKENTNKKKGIGKKGLLGILALVGTAAGATAIALNNKNNKKDGNIDGAATNKTDTQSTNTANKPNTQNTTQTNATNGVAKTSSKDFKYPEGFDLEYKTHFIDGLKEVYGLDKKVEDIQSIMGPQEFSELLEKLDGKDLLFHENAVDFMARIQRKRSPELSNVYTPKSGSEYYKYLNNEMSKEDHEKYLKPLIDGTCRLYLTSQVDHDIADPKEAAQHFLNRAVEYADKVARKVQDDKPAFTVGILEKDGIAIHQEIAKELAQNPEKYKNLKVIFGTGGEDKTLGGQKIEHRNYFIDPFDKELIKCCEEAEKERMDTLKGILKSVYILPEGEEVPLYSRLVKSNKNVNKYYPNGVPENWRTLTDKEIDEFLNDPTIKRYREYEKDNESILETFYTRYLAPHIEDEIEFGITKAHVNQTFSRAAKTAGWEGKGPYAFDYANYPMPKGYAFRELIGKQKNRHAATAENKTWFAMMFDQLDLRDYCKHVNNPYNMPTTTIPGGVASTFNSFLPEGQKYDYRALPTKEQITGMLDKENQKINMFYPRFKPTKYIFGDRIKTTEDLWKKIIE